MQREKGSFHRKVNASFVGTRTTPTDWFCVAYVVYSEDKNKSLMKVYYELNELQDENADNPLISNSLKLANEALVHISQKFKYRLMWELRHLENEINDDGGMIIFKKGRIETKNFTRETADKIETVLKSINWNVW